MTELDDYFSPERLFFHGTIANHVIAFLKIRFV